MSLDIFKLDEEMKFAQWMDANGLSESQIEKYTEAINGPLSLWADLQDFSTGPLGSIVDLNVFTAIAEKIESTEDFRVRNKRSHDMYSAALNMYREFLRSQNKP